MIISDVSKMAIIVQQGKFLDLINGQTQRNETPEEYVRQEIAKSLVREYRYAKADVEVEFVVRVGSRKPRAGEGLEDEHGHSHSLDARGHC